MHESLTETLHLAVTVITVCHHGKVRVHTGIPTTITLYAMACVVVFDIVALAGRTYKCAGTTCQTWFVKFFPYRRIKTVHVIFLSPSFKRKIRIWKFLYDRTNCSFLCFYFRLVCICKKLCNCFCKSFTLLCQRFPVKFSFNHPCCNICCRISTVNAKHFTETALFRFMTCKCNDCSMLSSCCIESIDRIT